MPSKDFMKNNDTYSNVLCSMAREHKFPHAVILECPDCKICEETALKVAKIFLCKSEDKPCDRCSDCVKMKSGYHPDVNLICPRGTGKSIKVEYIRSVRNDAYIASNEGSYKFYIIKNAEFMTVQAQNAFIKILEEPPEKVVFMLLCESSSTLLDTVKSRSQIFGLCKDLNSEEDSKSLSIAKNLAQSAAERDVCGILTHASKIPNDRKLLKNIIQDTISELLKMYSNGSFDSFDIKKFIDNLEEIKRLPQLADKNINFNLLVCYFCACLRI